MDDNLRLAYQSAEENIRFFKRQQWMVANYAILIYGSMVAIARLLGPLINEWLMCIIGTIAIFSFLLIIQLQCSTQIARNRLKEIKKAVKEEKLAEIVKVSLFWKETGCFAEFLDKYSVLSLLGAVILGGGILTVCVLWFLRDP